MRTRSNLIRLGIGFLCSTLFSCSLVFDSDEYLASENKDNSDGGIASSGSEEDGGEGDSGGSAQLPGLSLARDEVVVRLLDRDGEVLPIGGVRYQTEPGSADADPRQLQTRSLFPVFELESSDDPTSIFRVVDLAVSSWLEESNTTSQYPITVLVAAIVAIEEADDAASDGQPASGNLIVLTGIRGRREL